jgi:hypothetical protein
MSGLMQVEGVVSDADHQPFAWENAGASTLTIADGRKIDLAFEDAKGTIATSCSDLYCDPDEPEASRAA